MRLSLEQSICQGDLMMIYVDAACRCATLLIQMHYVSRQFVMHEE